MSNLNLEEKTLLELKELAKENNIKNISKLKKDDLIEVLSKVLDRSTTDNYNNDEPKVEQKSEQSKSKAISSNNDDEMNGYVLTSNTDQIVEGILDILPDGYGFLRGDNYLSSPKDVYVSMVQIRRFKLDTGDVIKGISRCKEEEKFPSLIYVPWIFKN